LLAVVRHVTTTRKYRQVCKILLQPILIGEEGALGVLVNQAHVSGLSKSLAEDGRSHVRAIGGRPLIARLVPCLHNWNAGGKGVRAVAGLIGRLDYCLQYLLEWSVFFLGTAEGTNKRGAYSVRLHFLASYLRLGLLLFFSSTKLGLVLRS
jgi:hypothetical protein